MMEAGQGMTYERLLRQGGEGRSRNRHGVLLFPICYSLAPCCVKPTLISSMPAGPTSKAGTICRR